MVGIVAAGAYVPLLRLQRAAMARATAWFNPGLAGHARGERALANWDEDTLTMAVEAARDCLWERDRAGIGKVILASTSLPFADRLNVGVVKEALNLPDALAALDVTGSQRAGTSALLAALESGRPTLCVASERRLAKPASEAEFVNGDAAAAFLVGDQAPIAEFLGSHSTTLDFVDHFRPTDRPYDYEWEGRWVRDEGYRKLIPPAVAEALKSLDLEAAVVDHFIAALPVAGLDSALAGDIGIRPEAVCASLRDTLGFAGAAHPLILLAQVLETARPGALIVLLAFGQGCDVLAFRVTDAAARRSKALGVAGWLARRRAETNYLKHLSFSGAVTLDGGMRAEIDLRQSPSMLYRERKTILSFVGGRCRETGTVQYPKTAVSVARNARLVNTQDDYPMAELRAEIVSFTADRLAYSPDPPSCYGIVAFEGGGRVMADFSDVDPDALAVGQSMRMMFRIKRQDGAGFKHYFWKAVPDYRPAPGDH
ncbi:OB-fold domain-containing protein [Brevundimonas sp.]|uniref:OB-fold domain-containing protein n=1 Tax=Brevundimonas sp. TaxID=1871086 RepID=UPI003564662B